MIYELVVKVPGYSGPRLEFTEGQIQDVYSLFPYTNSKNYDVCSKARAWLVPGIAKELGDGHPRTHLLIIESET